MTVLESLSSISRYPIPAKQFELVASRRNLTLSATVTSTMLDTAAYKLAEADLYRWLATAPDVSQGGQSYSFSSDQRDVFLAQANRIYDQNNQSAGVTYGYKGSKL